MANFYRALSILKKLEFSSCADALHKNEGERGYTFMGIYQKAHPSSLIWKRLKVLLKRYKIKTPTTSELKKISRIMCQDKELVKEVERIYRRYYWDKAKLDLVESQKIANEIFVFGVNAGMERAIKLAQKIVRVEADGVVGSRTLKALNSFDGFLFSVLYDFGEIWHYLKLSFKNQRYARYLKGWIKRAIKV
ncbi:MAG: peptidoglycan domain protein [Epsilonproteobacteria bacterium]|nr:peptidoglycan domain protein [Campylobacterota bacterium]